MYLASTILCTLGRRYCRRRAQHSAIRVLVRVDRFKKQAHAGEARTDRVATVTKGLGHDRLGISGTGGV